MLGSVALPCQASFAVQSSHRRMFVCASVAHALPMDRKSLYEVLRVKNNASQREIKTAYRTLAKLYHPDAASRFMDSSIASSTDGRDFIEIHNAYATLSDPNARAVYDLNLNVDPKRRWPTERFYQSSSRRWETDQCW